ncbi:MAG: winged helix-turn-helix domain-containing protein [Methanoregula sp.]|jgi:DNA-binding transcriptional ArsR family regulator
MGVTSGILTEMRELKTEVTGLRTELKRFIERANQQHVEGVLGDLKKNYSDLFTNHQVENAKIDLSAHMVKDCKMRDKCYEVFMDFLQNTSRHIKEGQVPDEIIQSYREQMKTMRSKGPYDRCETCFSEVHRLFEKQIDLMQSLGIYAKVREAGEASLEIPDEAVVKDLLEPVANIQRFQILKSLAIQTRSFSDISQLTGLRGGNLLFHIRKLTDSGMILQRHERGDYIITDKGYKTMTAIVELYRVL